MPQVVAMRNTEGMSNINRGLHSISRQVVRDAIVIEDRASRENRIRRNVGSTLHGKVAAGVGYKFQSGATESEEWPH